MRTETPQMIRLSEYTPPAYLVDTVDLTFRLDPKATRVTARIAFRRNPEASGSADLVLDGKNLTIVKLGIDDAELALSNLKFGDETLTVPAKLLPGDEFLWEAVVDIDPQGNTALEGLYMSKGMYCSQCEAEGFRKITYYPDRPDVLAVFTVRIEGDAPVLLSNGNPGERGDGFAVWHDPHPKPAYLFALVAGDLVAYSDSFTTKSGLDVALNIYVRAGDEDRCAYAMDSLKRSMKWDEDVYGCEYDLDVFNIVAVDDFNMGAMENKGLNIFNSKYVLASPETATDTDYELIEGIVAHEYFHNWTGNRITCRDWFQLSLKEGLTVYRDQCFSADMRSEAVQRIKDVRGLRARQFREDAGPLAHPVRPEQYIEINNFYTSTVYEKGAEVIRMLATLVGPDLYRKALNLYFERHDGQACTIEDWVRVFEDAGAEKLDDFKLWYAQAGTPKVSAQGDYADGVYSLTLEQQTAPSPGQDEKSPLTMPVTYGFIGANGDAIGEAGVLEFSQAKQTFTFELPESPTPSLFRGFSAPITLDISLSETERAHLLAHDTDPFNKWEAGRSLMVSAFVRLALATGAPSDTHLDALRLAALDESSDPAFRALVLSLPGEDEIAAHLHEAGQTPDPDAIHLAKDTLRHAIAAHMRDDLQALFEAHGSDAPYSPDAKQAGKRALRGQVLALITALDPKATLAQAQFTDADNMTEKLAALGQLVATGNGAKALSEFHARWKDDPNVLDKWFALQAAQTPPDQALAAVSALSAHEDFNWKTPNRFRALWGGFSQNSAAFHVKDGEGYKLFTDWLLKLDRINPQTASRMSGVFETWTHYDDTRRGFMMKQLSRIMASPDLSKDCTEMVGRMLDAGI